MAARQYISTASEKTLQGSGILTNTQSSITLNDSSGLPPLTGSQTFTLVINPGTATEEIVTVTSYGSGNVLNISRGQDGTIAQSTHAVGSTVKHMITARDLQEPQDHIDASQNIHGIGASSSVVGTATTQTLTNKTLVSPVITTSASIANPTLTGNIDISGWTDSAWTSYTPTISGWTKSNGTVTGSYKKIGRLVFFKGNYVVGSSDTVSTSALTISLPTGIAAVDSNTMIAHGRASLTGVGNGNPAINVIQNTTTTIQPQLLFDSNASAGTNTYISRNTGVTSNNYTRNAGDSIYFNGFYESAS